MSLREHTMSEEFKPIRITLSQEAFDRLEQITKHAAFRNYSSTIEECIRVVYEIMNDVYEVIGRKGESGKHFSQSEAFHTFIIIGTRMTRFTGRQVKVVRTE